MKRYLLFMGADYYPAGGWDDFGGSFDSPKEAFDHYRERKAKNRYNWFQIIDGQTGDEMDGTSQENPE